MSPVHIPRGFTKAYIAGEVVEDLGATLLAAHASYHDHEILLVEGTGHAGVGAVIGLSNAVVARMLGTPTVIISEGGVGRPIDEIVLNASLFRAHGVEVAGAIVNKVDMDAQPGIAAVLERGLAMHGIPLLGVLPVPADPLEPDAGDDPRGRSRRDDPSGPRSRPGDRRRRGRGDGGRATCSSGSGRARLVIVPGDREDVILTLTTRPLRATAPAGERRRGGQDRVYRGRRHERERGLDRRSRGRRGRARADRRLPAPPGGRRRDPRVRDLRDDRQGGHVRCRVEVHDLLVKTHAADRDKIAEIKALVAEHLDIDRMLSVATEAAVTA